jgi:ParB family chromosome partitioning protein
METPPPPAGALEVPIEKIAVATNVRAVDETSLGELVESIRVQGILEPLIVRQHLTEKTGKPYELVCGYRRLTAARKLKLETVPVIVKELNDGQVLEVQLTENLQREDLNPIDEALSLQKYRTATKCSEEKVGKAIGKSQAYVANRLRLLHLPEAAKGLIRHGILSARHGEVLLTLPQETPQADVKSLIEVAVARKQSARELEECVNIIRNSLKWRQADEKRRQAEAKRQAAALTKLKFKKCPKCGRLATGVYGDQAQCAMYHVWSAKTGKPPVERESWRQSNPRTYEKALESKVIRSFHDALSIARKVMEDLKPADVHAVSLWKGNLSIAMKGSHKGGFSIDVTPHQYKEGEQTSVAVRAWDAKQIKDMKAAYKNWEKENLPKAATAAVKKAGR